MPFERLHNLPAWDLLASQPERASMADSRVRDRLVISAQIDDAGDEHVLSRFGDPVWDLRPFIDQPGVAECSKFIRWPSDCGPDMVNDCKAVLYAWVRSGRAGMNPPHWITVKGVAVASCLPLMRWLQRLGVTQFSQVTALHISNYRHHCQHELRLSPWGVFNRLHFLDLLWAFNHEAAYGLTLNPWGASTLMAVCNLSGTKADARERMTGTAKTPIIPSNIQTAIFRHCEAVLAKAPALLDARDRGEIRPTSSELVAVRGGSLSMTQLYASNPQQDRALFDEILSEITAYKGELLGTWTGNIPLSGGAGHRIVALRATPHSSRESLLSSAAEQIHIRATGHGWCLAQDEGCGGAGLYEATRCVDCKNAVIDDSFADTWLGIHEQQRELLALDDVGPAVHQRARRDADRSASVLADLGIEIPQATP